MTESDVVSSYDSPLVPMPKKTRGKGGIRSGLAVTLYLADCWPAYARMCKSFGQSASSRLSALMKADLEKLGGGSNSRALNQVRIAELEALLSENKAKGKKMQGLLIQENIFFDLRNLADSFGLDSESFGNVKIVARKLLEYKPLPTDQFTRDDLLFFVSVINLAAQKARLQTELRSLLLIDTEPLVEIQPTIVNAESTGGAKPIVPSTSELQEETETKSPQMEEDEENLDDSEN